LCLVSPLVVSSVTLGMVRMTETGEYQKNVAFSLTDVTDKQGTEMQAWEQ